MLILEVSVVLFVGGSYSYTGNEDDMAHLAAAPGLQSCLFYRYMIFLTGLCLMMSGTSNGWPFSLLNDEQMRNKVRVGHQPATFAC